MAKNQNPVEGQIEEAKEKVEELSIELKENWINKLNKKNDEIRLAQAQKKAQKEKAKADKKAEKETSEKKKVPIGVKIAGGVALVGAIGTAVVKVIQNQNVDAVDGETLVTLTDEPAAEIPETTEPQEVMPEES